MQIKKCPFGFLRVQISDRKKCSKSKCFCSDFRHSLYAKFRKQQSSEFIHFFGRLSRTHHTEQAQTRKKFILYEMVVQPKKSRIWYHLRTIVHSSEFRHTGPVIVWLPKHMGAVRNCLATELGLPVRIPNQFSCIRTFTVLVCMYVLVLFF